MAYEKELEKYIDWCRSFASAGRPCGKDCDYSVCEDCEIAKDTALDAAEVIDDC